MFRDKAKMSFRIKQRHSFDSRQRVKIKSVFEAALSKPPVTGCRNKFDSFFYPVHKGGGKEIDSLGELKRDWAFARLSQE